MKVTKKHLDHWVQEKCGGCGTRFKVGQEVEGFNGGMAHKKCPPQKITLLSTEMVNTPNIILWAVRGMSAPKARKFLNLAFPDLPKWAVDKLLKEDFAVDTSKDGVEFSDVVIYPTMPLKGV